MIRQAWIRGVDGSSNCSRSARTLWRCGANGYDIFVNSLERPDNLKQEVISEHIQIVDMYILRN